MLSAMKINIIIYLLFLFLSPIAYSQTDSIAMPHNKLPSDSLLFAALDNHYQQQVMAQVTEFQIKEKHHWLKYIPAISFGYTLSTNTEGQLSSKLRPSVSFSTNTIYQVFQDKEKRLAKIKTIQQINLLNYQTAKAELQQLLKNYQLLIQDYQFLQQLNEIDGQLYEIATAQFESAQLAPSAYLPKKRAFMQKQYQLFQKQQEIESLHQQILITSTYIQL